MSAEKPLSVEEILADERRALRPDDAGAGTGASDGSPLSALCVSGGGIRSATFGLGAIQGLAQHGILHQFDYLSTVSGGGYVGSWLTAWAKRAGGLGQVITRLRRDAPLPAEGEADPIQHLREYNSYLSPRLGAFSADLWTLLSTVVRNIILNWLVLIPLMMFVLMLPRLFLSLLTFPEVIYSDAIFKLPEGAFPSAFARPEPDYGSPVLDAVSGSLFVSRVLPAMAVALLATALFFILRYLPGVGGRDHSRFAYIRGVLLPLIGAVLAFMAFDSLYYLGSFFTPESNIVEVLWWMLVAAAAAWLLNLAVNPRPFRERIRLLFGPLSLAMLSMAAGIGLSTWVATNFVLYNPNPDLDLSWAAYVTLGLPVILGGFGLGTVLFVGLSSTFLKDEDREWMSRAMATVLIVGVGWLAVCGVVLVLPQWALTWHTWGHGALALGAALSAWLSALSGSFVANANPGAAASAPSPTRLLALASRVAPPVFIALLAGALSVLTNIILQGMHSLEGTPLLGEYGQSLNWRDHYGMLDRSHPGHVALLALALLVLSWIMARYVNINTFSLHAMYRDRLVRAYLGASNPDRKASRFTGFAANDDMPMASIDPGHRPFHVVNLTLNLVAASRLAWQQRKAESFTVTPLHSGSSGLGYRPSSEYGGGITLGSAVALSGAAASPNMGYHSSPVVSFIMTLFNARLGAWLGNPGPPGKDSWKQPGPLSAIRSLIKEALGQTSDRSKFVYLSDGGHFENLGLYEMVRRRCRQIVVLDSGCDPDFTYDDLGNALRKIRIDLGIPITFPDQHTRPLRERQRRCAVAIVEYSRVDPECEDGFLVYIKPLLRGGEPPDVASYAAAHPAFPHQSTADQWFDESQTESYRSLGLISIDEICAGWSGGDLESLRQHVETVYLPTT
jgi:hypothetical protein